MKAATLGIVFKYLLLKIKYLASKIIQFKRLKEDELYKPNETKQIERLIAINKNKVRSHEIKWGNL